MPMGPREILSHKTDFDLKKDGLCLLMALKSMGVSKHSAKLR